jgi:hypothetical protein
MGSALHSRSPARRGRPVPSVLRPAARSLLVALSASFATAQSPPLPEAPTPENFLPATQPQANPCQIHNIGASMAAVASLRAAEVTGLNASNSHPAVAAAVVIVPCPPKRPNWYDRFTDGPTDKHLTPKDKAWLAARNVVDPVNGISLVGTSAIVVGANSHSAYGPGMAGFGRNVGVAYAQDMTGEFFGTFFIPSIFHQNPHYRRLPHATFPRRLLNTVTQVFWGQSDNGNGMLNYANIIGYAINDEVANLYVPGRTTNLPSSAIRYGVTFAYAPTNNLISEFLPDVARRFHFQNVIIQRLLNTVARPDEP